MQGLTCAIANAGALAPAGAAVGQASVRQGASIRSSLACRALSTTNPALKYANFQQAARDAPSSKVGLMTLDGAISKTAVLLLITVAGAAYSWQMFFNGMVTVKTHAAALALSKTLQNTSMMTFVASLALSMLTAFKPNWAALTSPFYAAFKGAFLGAVSASLEMRYPGLVMNAVALTLSIAASLLVAFKANVIAVNDRFRNTTVLAMSGVFVTYMGSMLLRMVGVNMNFLHNGMTGLAITGVVAVISAASLLLDFDTLQRMEMQRFPKWAEWYGGFTVLVSLLWLYFEILRFLSIFARSRSN